MKKVIKYFFVLLVTLLLIDCPMVNAEVKTYERTEDNLGIWDSINVTETNKQNILGTPKVDEAEKVYDFADLFTLDEEQQLYDKIQAYIEEFNMDMVIVTINENSKSSSMEYADDFYDYNYFGINDSKDGILFLIDMDTRNIYISTTGKAINEYNDSRIDDMLDRAHGYMISEDYYEAAEAFIEEASYKDPTLWIFMYIVSFLAATIPTVIFIFKNRMIRKATEASRYMEENSVNITAAKDVFITTHTSRHAKQSSSSGSSTHTGSSGTSHGGGGRSF